MIGNNKVLIDNEHVSINPRFDELRTDLEEF
jgi:hypothetical protein